MGKTESIRDSNIQKEEIYPESLDLTCDLPPIRNQGEQGTCAAQTAACMKEYQEKNAHKMNPIPTFKL